MSDTPVEVQFTSAGCLNYPCRTPYGEKILDLSCPHICEGILNPRPGSPAGLHFAPLGGNFQYGHVVVGLETDLDWSGLTGSSRYALQMCDELLPATFLEKFGDLNEKWPLTTIEEIAEAKPNAIRTGPFGSQLLHSEFGNTGIAVLGIDNAVKNRFEWADRRYITAEKYAQLKRYTVFPGDIIITIMGTCGRCAVIPKNVPLAINTKHLCCITLDQDKAVPAFLHAAFLYHPRIRHQLGLAEKGAIMEGLNMGIIKDLSLPLPPLSLQRTFTKFVDEHERLRSTQVEAVRQADHLFQALLHQAFG
jgi:type I restriction enzyme, S subunit